MSEGGPLGRSSDRLRATRMCRGCCLWFYCPIGLSIKTIGLSARVSNKHILISSPSSVWSRSFGTDWPGLALLIRGKQRKPGSWERKAVTARRFFLTSYSWAEALSARPGGLTRNSMSVMRDSWRMVATVLADIFERGIDFAPLAAARSED